MSDREAGLVTGMWREPTAAAPDFAARDTWADPGGIGPMRAPFRYHAACVHVVTDSDGAARVRLQTYINEMSTLDRFAADRFWTAFEARSGAVAAE